MTTTAAPGRNIGSSGDMDGALMPTQPPPFLRASDVARLFGQERARARYRDRCRAEGRQPDPDEEAAVVAEAPPVAARTVYSYRRESISGRYRDNPMPAGVYADGQPRRGQIPVWLPDDGETLADLEARIRAWWHTRPGPGAGGGPKPRDPSRRRRRGG